MCLRFIGWGGEGFMCARGRAGGLGWWRRAPAVGGVPRGAPSRLAFDSRICAARLSTSRQPIDAQAVSRGPALFDFSSRCARGLRCT